MENKDMTNAVTEVQSLPSLVPAGPPTAKEPLHEATVRLAKLSIHDYELARLDEAKKYNVRVSVLDNMVIGMRALAKRASEASKSNSPCEDDDELENGVSPWHEPVDGAELATEIFNLIKRHVILSDEQATAITLWLFSHYSINLYGVFAKLLITSPEMRCGKTTLLWIMHALVNRVFPSSNVTVAVIYRSIEKWQPTLLIDEADTFINKEGNEEMKGIINSSYGRLLAKVPRNVGDGMNMDIKRFSTWAPIVISMIGLPDKTIVDRSIHIRMIRKLSEQGVRYWSIENYKEFKPLRQKLQRWNDDNASALKESPYAYKDKSDLTVFDGYGDRTKDNWSPLLAAASLLSAEWHTRGLEALKALDGWKENDVPTGTGVELLSDIKAIFEERGCREIYSSDLIEDLVKMEDRPWAEYRRGRPINAWNVAKLLKPFSIKAKQLFRGIGKKGYLLNDLKEVFKRYL